METITNKHTPKTLLVLKFSKNLGKNQIQILDKLFILSSVNNFNHLITSYHSKYC